MYIYNTITIMFEIQLNETCRSRTVLNVPQVTPPLAPAPAPAPAAPAPAVEARLQRTDGFKPIVKKIL